MEIEAQFHLAWQIASGRRELEFTSFCLYLAFDFTSSECFRLGFGMGHLLLSHHCLHEGVSSVFFRFSVIFVESRFASQLEHTDTVDRRNAVPWEQQPRPSSPQLSSWLFVNTLKSGLSPIEGGGGGPSTLTWDINHFTSNPGSTWFHPSSVWSSARVDRMRKASWRGYPIYASMYAGVKPSNAAAALGTSILLKWPLTHAAYGSLL